jgi:hypothetical protein
MVFRHGAGVPTGAMEQEIKARAEHQHDEAGDASRGPSVAPADTSRGHPAGDTAGGA